MNICVIANSSWNIFNFRFSLIKELQCNNYNVIAVAPYDEYTSHIINSNIKFIELTKLNRKSRNPFLDIRLINEIKKIYIKYNIDISLLFTIKPVIYGSIASRNLKTKVVCTLTGLGYSFISKGITNFLVRKLYQYALRYADRVYFHNNDDLLLFKKMNIPKEKLFIVNGSGIDSNFYKRSNPYCKSKPFKFYFIGRLLFDKGIREFLEAAEIVTNILGESIEFYIIGDIDPQNPSSLNRQDLIRWENTINIHFLGYQKNTKYFLSIANAVVLPSYREGLPKVLIESMSMEIPIITTNVPGCKETVIDNKNGILVNSKDVKSLVNAMIKMANIDESELKLMGKVSREIIMNKFDQKIINYVYLDCIDNI